MVLNLQSVGLSPEQFFRLCGDNPELRMELTARGGAANALLIIHHPDGLIPTQFEVFQVSDFARFVRTILIVLILGIPLLAYVPQRTLTPAGLALERWAEASFLRSRGG